MKEQYIINNEKFTTVVDKDGITVKPKEIENKTIEDLKQKLINELYDLEYLDCRNNEIDLLKFLLTIEKD